MNTRRRTTVHDLAALRVHRDGSRLANSDTNRASRRARYAVRDARGNWLAKDAGGLGTVKVRRSASQPEGAQDGNEDGDDVGLADEEEQMEEGDVSLRKDKGKGRADSSEEGEKEEEDEEGTTVNTRAQKRRRFDEDLSYLNSGASPAPVPPLSGDPPHSHPTGEDFGTFPEPSSDLLKCLHYFASTYYTAMGQLYDASREFRKERKIRRAQKLKTVGPSRRRGSGGEDIKLSEDEGDDDEEENDDEAGAADAENGEEDGKRGSGKRKRPQTNRHVTKDMYKLFDGSALMALGMLLQEHIAELLEPNVPEGWEKEFAVAERNRQADEKKSRKAREMWNQRHPGKPEGSEQPAAQFDDEVGEARLSEQEEVDEEEDEDEEEGQGPVSKQSVPSRDTASDSSESSESESDD